MQKIFVLLLFTLCSCVKNGVKPDLQKSRIISTAPSLTTLFQFLKLESHLVGVSNQSQIKNVAKVGTFTHLNIEMIAALSPTMVYLSPYVQRKTFILLKKLQIPFKIIEQNSKKTILNSMDVILHDTQASDQSYQLKKMFELKMNEYNGKLKNTFENAAFVVGFTANSKSLKNLYVASRKSVFHDILTDLGLRNIMADKNVANTIMGGELLHQRNPSAIFHIIDDSENENAVKQMWLRLKTLQAVEQKNVYILKNSAYFIPGPGILALIDKIYKIVKGADTCCSI